MGKRKKIALVNQRYGLDINGGSETLCRQMAEKLAAENDIEVITTCALDYTTWKNHYSSGVEIINGVTVRRFKNELTRSRERFQRISDKIIGKPHSDTDEDEWLKQQGPYCPIAVEYIKEHHNDYDVVIFMTYLYYITAKSMPLGLDNAILLPTAHDEIPIYFKCFKEVFESAQGIIYLTDEEKEFVDTHFKVENIPYVITGGGVDIPEVNGNLDNSFLQKIPENYVLYMGRIEAGKGCKMLFDYFMSYKVRNESNLKLVLAGKTSLEIPEDNNIIYMGFVSDEEKFELIRRCKLLVLASEFESLSMVVLESMACNKPVLVNGKCMVLRGHCIKSNAGLYFDNFFEFEGSLNYILTHEKEYEIMCENGKKYVDQNYRWDVILSKINSLIESVESGIQHS